MKLYRYVVGKEPAKGPTVMVLSSNNRQTKGTRRSETTPADEERARREGHSNSAAGGLHWRTGARTESAATANDRPLPPGRRKLARVGGGAPELRDAHGENRVKGRRRPDWLRCPHRDAHTLGRCAARQKLTQRHTPSAPQLKKTRLTEVS